MKTGEVMVMVCAALLGTFLSVSQAIAVAAPPADELAQLEERLIAAQGQIAGGNIEAGQKALDEIKKAAQEKLSARWRFVAKLTEAAVALKAGSLDTADQSLRQVAAAAEKPDQFASALTVGTNLLQQFQKKGQKAQAENLVSFFGKSSAKDVQDLDVQCRMASLLLIGGDPARAEEAVTKATGLAKEQSEWNRIAELTWSLTDAGGTPAAASAACARLVPLAKTDVAKAAMTARMLKGISNSFGAVHDLPSIDRALAKLEAVRKTAQSVSTLSRELALAENMSSAFKSFGAGDQTGTLKALRDANNLVKDKPLDARALYEEGKLLIVKSLLAKNNLAAAEIAQFIEEGPGRQVDSFGFRLQMGQSWVHIGDLKKAEASLIVGAPMVKTKSDAEMYGAWAFVVVNATKPVEAKLAVMDHLVSAAPAAPKAALVETILKNLGVSFATAYDPAGMDAAVKVLEAVKKPAAGVPALAPRVTLVTLMSSAYASAKSGNYADALKALQEAHGLVKDNVSDASALYGQGKYLFTKSLASKDKASAQGFADFLAAGPGKQIEPRIFHMDMAQIWLNLGDLKKAEESLTAAAPLVKAKTDLTAWGDRAFDVLNGSNPMEAKLAVADRLIPAAPEGGKAVLIDHVLKELSGLFNGKSDDAALAANARLLAAVKAPAGTIPSLSQRLTLVTKMFSAHEAAKSADQAGVMKALREASEAAKDQHADAAALYAEGRLLIMKSLAAKDKAAAAEIAQFLTDGPGKQIDPCQFRLEMACTWANIGDFSRAEDLLIDAAPLVKTKVNADMWSGWAFVVLNNSNPVEAKITALNRMIGAAPESPKNLLLEAVLKHLGGAFNQQWDDAGFAAHGRLFDAVKGLSGAVPSLSARTAFVAKMFSAHTLARSGRHGDALKAVQEAYEFAKDKPADAVTVYGLGGQLFRRSIAAKDTASARAFADFLAAGPGKQVEPCAFHTGMAHVWLDLREFKKAEESLVAAAPLAKQGGAADSWGREVFYLALAQSPPKEGTAVFDRMAPLSASAEARTALTIWKADFSVRACNPVEAEKLVAQIPAVSADGKPVFRAIGLRYSLASSYVVRGNTEAARRLFGQVDSAAQLLTKEEALRAIEQAFGPTLRNLRTDIIAPLLKASASRPPIYLLTAYCKAAAASGRADEAIRLITEIQAKPSYFVVLATYLKGFGDVAHARQVLDAIPKPALNADPALAKAVAEFWPTDSDKVKAEIERCRGLIAAYEQRAKAAQAAGQADLVKQCEEQVKTLTERIAALEKEMGK